MANTFIYKSDCVIYHTAEKKIPSLMIQKSSTKYKNFSPFLSPMGC